MNSLYDEIKGDLNNLTSRIDALAKRADLSDVERADLQELLVKWKTCKSHAQDNSSAPTRPWRP